MILSLLGAIGQHSYFQLLRGELFLNSGNVFQRVNVHTTYLLMVKSTSRVKSAPIGCKIFLGICALRCWMALGFDMGICVATYHSFHMYVFNGQTCTEMAWLLFDAPKTKFSSFLPPYEESSLNSEESEILLKLECCVKWKKWRFVR